MVVEGLFFCDFCVIRLDFCDQIRKFKKNDRNNPFDQLHDLWVIAASIVLSFVVVDALCFVQSKSFPLRFRVMWRWSLQVMTMTTIS